MRQFVRWLPVLFIVAGLCVISYPKLSEYYYTKQQQALIEEWERSFRQIAVVDASTADHTRLVDEWRSSEAAPEEPGDLHATRLAEALPEHVEGMLYIDELDLELPILRGATEANLNKSIASIAGTAGPGDIGNYAIAGHRHRTFGRNFNRLNELVAGDRIEVDTGVQSFVYTVTETLLVKPDEVWVLEGNDSDREITLVTCHPIVNATHRLIVKGVIDEQ